MLRRWGTRLAFSLVGIAAGLLLCTAALSSFSVSAAALVEATLLFWLVHIVVQFLALKVLIALLIVNAIVSGMHIGGPETYVPATLIIWACTAVADALGTRRIRDERADRRAERRDR